MIDILFSPQDHDVPAGVSIEKLRRHADEFYQLQVTSVRHTPPGELKPNPRILQDILETIGSTPDRCAYVGDSLFKDVAMAREVGILDIHAQYGESQRKPEYKLLQNVSHWTQEDVDREASITSKGHSFTPSVVLKDSFAEIFMHCDFVAFCRADDQVSAEQETKNAIEIWKKCVDVHQHFNDLEMRIRNFALTVVGALIAAVSFTYQQGLQTHIFGTVIPAGLGLVAAAFFAWLGFFFMDRYWYHILLKGAVMHSAKIEKRYVSSLPSIGLGLTISEASGNVRIFGIRMNSDRRLEAFYLVGAVMIGVVFFFLLLSQSNQTPSAIVKPFGQAPSALSPTPAP